MSRIEAFNKPEAAVDAAAMWLLPRTNSERPATTGRDRFGHKGAVLARVPSTHGSASRCVTTFGFRTHLRGLTRRVSALHAAYQAKDPFLSQSWNHKRNHGQTQSAPKHLRHTKGPQTRAFLVARAGFEPASFGL
jgi:hypothetical protein